MEECELVWQQCRKIDKLLLEILNEEDNEEAGSKKEDVQLEYEERMEELREAISEYLAKRVMEPPSVRGSVAGCVIDPGELPGERKEPMENTREISETRDPFDITRQTRSSENVHFRRVPFQSTMTADRSAADRAAENRPTTEDPHKLFHINF